jgi:uncharacterized protein
VAIYTTFSSLSRSARTLSAVTEQLIETPHGPARAHIHGPRGKTGALALGHGAGGGVGAGDLVAATEVALAAGLRVVLVEQPYRVAGRRSQAPAAQLDAAWIAVIADLRRRRQLAGALIVGGRSAGARVACRTAAETRAAGVLCLAFPVHPPGHPEKSRLPELDAVSVPTLVVQGESDPFGMPPAAPERTVVRVKGNHSLKGDIAAVRTAIADWLATRTGAPAAR